MSLISGFISNPIDHFNNEIEEFKDAYENKNIEEAFYEMLDVIAFLSLEEKTKELLYSSDLKATMFVTYCNCYSQREDLYAIWRENKLKKYPNSKVVWLDILRNLSEYLNNSCITLDYMIYKYYDSKEETYLLSIIKYVSDNIHSLGNFIINTYPLFIMETCLIFTKQFHENNFSESMYLYNYDLTYDEARKVISTLKKINSNQMRYEDYIPISLDIRDLLKCENLSETVKDIILKNLKKNSEIIPFEEYPEIEAFVLDIIKEDPKKIKYFTNLTEFSRKAVLEIFQICIDNKIPIHLLNIKEKNFSSNLIELLKSIHPSHVYVHKLNYSGFLKDIPEEYQDFDFSDFKDTVNAYNIFAKYNLAIDNDAKNLLVNSVSSNGSLDKEISDEQYNKIVNELIKNCHKYVNKNCIINLDDEGNIHELVLLTGNEAYVIDKNYKQHNIKKYWTVIGKKPAILKSDYEKLKELHEEQFQKFISEEKIANNIHLLNYLLWEHKNKKLDISLLEPLSEYVKIEVVGSFNYNVKIGDEKSLLKAIGAIKEKYNISE